MVLNEDIHEFDYKEERRWYKVLIKFIKETIQENIGYKRLWEEQNKLLDEKNLELRKRNTQLLNLRTRLEEKERELRHLKAQQEQK